MKLRSVGIETIRVYECELEVQGGDEILTMSEVGLKFERNCRNVPQLCMKHRVCKVKCIRCWGYHNLQLTWIWSRVNTVFYLGGGG